jgi:hypothetical protein
MDLNQHVPRCRDRPVAELGDGQTGLFGGSKGIYRRTRP